MGMRSQVEAIVSSIVFVHPHEIPALIHSASCFFFILTAYFVILPLRDEGAISLGLDNLPGLFVGSLFLTLLAAPISTLVFSLPNLPKARALVWIHRFFSVSLLVFFILWHASSTGNLSPASKASASNSTLFEDEKLTPSQEGSVRPSGWSNHGWFYVIVRISLFLWVALLNLVTISSTWARVIDVMDTESGSRLFGFIGAGATFGQLFGSLFAASMAWLGPFLLLFSALMMELAAQTSKGINRDAHSDSINLSTIRENVRDQHTISAEETSALVKTSPKSVTHMVKTQPCTMLEGLWLIMSSTYLLYVSLFLWLSAVVSSFFYFQKVTIIAMTAVSPIARRRSFALINSFIAVFILAGQLTLTGRILTVAGITITLCSAPFVATSNMVVLAVWPTWITVAITETIRKVTTYVVTRPGRELLFTVVSQDEKYKAKIFIDVIVQRLGDATAAGVYKLLFGSLNNRTSMVSLYALPATQYIGENKTQTEIIEMLHQACSNVDPFEEQCVMLVDFYASLFFAEISKIHPEVFCTKFNLCEEMVSVNLPKNDDSWLSCSLCHDVVANVLVKLKDPDIQFEVIKMLLEGCNGVQHHVNECKKLVLHYGPLILENGENFLEITDVCVAIHSCKTSQVEFIGTASTEQASLIEQ